MGNMGERSVGFLHRVRGGQHGWGKPSHYYTTQRALRIVYSSGWACPSHVGHLALYAKIQRSSPPYCPSGTIMPMHVRLFL